MMMRLSHRMTTLSALLLLLLYSSHTSQAFTIPSVLQSQTTYRSSSNSALHLASTTGTTASTSSSTATVATPDTAFVAPDVVAAGIAEELCIDTANRMQRTLVPVDPSIHPDGVVGISYSHWPATHNDSGGNHKKHKKPPVVLVHGFDSSNLEFRRLGSRLAEREDGTDVYAVDLLGWGYTQLEGVADFGAKAKVQALQSWIDTVVLQRKENDADEDTNNGFVIAGASLGGAAAIETAVLHPHCHGLVLIDAQGFVDGIGPMSFLPKFVAQVGVSVLQSVPLRSSANDMSYYDKAYATDEAVVVGRLHCLRDGWKDALVNFMQSGGFAPSGLVPRVPCPTLVLWGRQDTILDGAEFAPKFLDTLPRAELRWIEESGHVPHLEQPDETAEAIAEFVASVEAEARD